MKTFENQLNLESGSKNSEKRFFWDFVRIFHFPPYQIVLLYVLIAHLLVSVLVLIQIRELNSNFTKFRMDALSPFIIKPHK